MSLRCQTQCTSSSTHSSACASDSFPSARIGMCLLHVPEDDGVSSAKCANARFALPRVGQVLCALADYYAAAKCIGPLASFDVSELWVEHPYRDGVVLMAMRRPPPTPPTARAFLSPCVLREFYGTNSSQIPIGLLRQITTPKSIAAGACCTVEGWFRTLFQDPSSQSAALRKKAMPLIARDQAGGAGAL